MVAGDAPVLDARALQAGAQWVGSTLALSTYANTAFLHAGGSATEHTLTRICGAALLGTLAQLARMAPAAVVARLRAHAAGFAVPALALLLANYFNSVCLSRCGAQARARPRAAAA